MSAEKPPARRAQLPIRREQPPALVPATRADLTKFKAMVLASFKIPGGNVIADPQIYLQQQMATLARHGFSVAVLQEALKRALTCEDWLPSTARMVRLCKAVRAESRARKRQQAADERERRDSERRHLEKEEQQAALEAFVTKRKRHRIPPGDATAAWEAIALIVGNDEARRWSTRIYEEKPWAFDALNYMASVWKDHEAWPPPKGGVDDPGKKAWMNYRDIRVGRKMSWGRM
jgi:hypothetical protein